MVLKSSANVRAVAYQTAARIINSMLSPMKAISLNYITWSLGGLLGGWKITSGYCNKETGDCMICLSDTGTEEFIEQHLYKYVSFKSVVCKVI